MSWNDQVRQLTQAYPYAVVRSRGVHESSGHLVTIPHFRLRRCGRDRRFMRLTTPANAWDRDEVTIHFFTPPGFPGCQPDGFWADPDLKLANGWVNGEDRETPAGADWRVRPDWEPGGWKKEGGFGRYFRLHLQAFNPNHDTIYTFAKVIDLRLQAVR